jgi:hypothetical protein
MLKHQKYQINNHPVGENATRFNRKQMAIAQDN